MSIYKDMTVGEFLEGVDNFYYSFENFQLVKEMSEMTLLDIFLYNNKIEENGTLQPEQLVVLKEMVNVGDDFEFTESVYMEMQQSLMQKIKQFIPKLLRILAKPFLFLYTVMKHAVDRVGKWVQLKFVIEKELKALDELMKVEENRVRLNKALPSLLAQIEVPDKMAHGIFSGENRETLGHKLAHSLQDTIFELTKQTEYDREIWNRVGNFMCKPTIAVPSFYIDMDSIANQFIGIMDDIGNDIGSVDGETIQKHIDGMNSLKQQIPVIYNYTIEEMDPMKMKSTISQLESFNKSIQSTLDKIEQTGLDKTDTRGELDQRINVDTNRMAFIQRFKDVSLAFQSCVSSSIRDVQGYIHARDTYISRFHALLVAMQKAAKGVVTESVEGGRVRP